MLTSWFECDMKSSCLRLLMPSPQHTSPPQLQSPLASWSQKHHQLRWAFFSRNPNSNSGTTCQLKLLTRYASSACIGSIRWAHLLQEFDMKILNQRKINDAMVDVLLMAQTRMEEQEGKLCIPDGTTVSLNGITKRTFENLDPPAIHPFTSSLKVEVRKEHDFDKNNYPNDLCPSKMARIDFSMNASKREKKVGTKAFFNYKSREERKLGPCRLYRFP